jgi:hypothetical protein
MLPTGGGSAEGQAAMPGAESLDLQAQGHEINRLVKSARTDAMSHAAH